MRPSKKEFYLNIAKVVASRSTCIRRKYGAVIVNEDDIVLSLGYNGAPRGEANCCDVGYCYRKQNNIPHGEQYEKCCSQHAEVNAIMFAGGKNTKGATLYLYGENYNDGSTIEEIEPCLMCRRAIANANIQKIITPSGELLNRRRGLA